MIKILRDLVLSVVKPIIVFMGKLHLPFTHKQFTGEDYYKIRDSLAPGDFILTTTRGEVSNIFNSSIPKHGAIYIGGSTVKYVVEAVGKGVIKTDLVSFLLSKDEVTILRPKNVSKVHRINACNFAQTKIGLPYDLEFESGDEEYYCFELVIAAYKHVLPNREFASDEIWGVKTYTGQAILRDTENWEVYYDNRT